MTRSVATDHRWHFDDDGRAGCRLCGARARAVLVGVADTGDGFGAVAGVVEYLDAGTWSRFEPQCQSKRPPELA